MKEKQRKPDSPFPAGLPALCNGGFLFCSSEHLRPSNSVSGLEKSAAIRPFATKKSHLASEKILLADSLATESCRLADRLATKLFFKADNADADRM